MFSRILQHPPTGRLERTRQVPCSDSSEGHMSFLLELWEYMGARKKFWLLPLLLVLLVFGGLIVLAKGSAIAPFIYTIF